MKLWFLGAVGCVAFGWCPAASAQEADDLRLDLRVTGAAGGGRAVVDHGRDLGLALGDRVRFRPLNGEPLDGTVLELEDRRATVALLDPSREVPIGTRAEAWIPRDRAPAEEPKRTPVVPEHEPWQEDGWEEDMPLLGEIEAVRPEERDRSLTARAYTIFDTTLTTDSERSSSFFRTGADVAVDNPYGRGGGLHLDAEVNYRRTEVPDEDGESQGRLRIDRVSYFHGGTRFEPERWEVGRFLQHGVPEFGLLDGFEYERRVEGQNRVGMSLGWMPEPTPRQETGKDFQLSAHYEWLYDESERLAVLGGYQKTWHEGDADRDLFFARVRFLPVGPWSFHGAAWVDLYRPEDEIKDGGTEITQAYATAARDFENGSGLSLAYDRLRYPELLRDEFREIDPATLIDGGYDRVSLEGWRWLNERQRFRTRLGLWDGDDDSGGDLEIGLEVERFRGRDARLMGSLFSVRGQFSSIVGGRLVYSENAAGGHWDALYELARHDQDGFDVGNDDLFLHRLRAGRIFTSAQGWSLSFYGEGVVEDDFALTMGLAFQHGF